MFVSEFNITDYRDLSKMFAQVPPGTNAGLLPSHYLMIILIHVLQKSFACLMPYSWMPAIRRLKDA